MAQINQLSTLSTLTAADLLPVYSSENSDARKMSITTLTTYLNNALSFPTFNTQRSSPSAGTTVQVTDGSNNVHLILTPSGTLATLTIKLPAKVNTADKQEILVNCTQAVTTLSFNSNGVGDIVGEPASLSANGYFRLKLDKDGDVWYRVG